MGEDLFESDLRRWVLGFYTQRELLRAERARVTVEGLFDREFRFLTWLAAQLMLSIALLPLWGAWGVLGGLAILYVGTFVSGAWILDKERHLTRRTSSRAVEEEAEHALADRPRLDGDARARLIRLMNLTALQPTPGSLRLLSQELREAVSRPTLAQWRFLHDLSAIVDSPDGARLGTLRPRLVE